MSEVASQVFGPTSGLRVLVADLRCRSEGNCSEALFVRRLSGLVSPSREKEGEKERERERFGAETGERGRERERETHTHTHTHTPATVRRARHWASLPGRSTHC